MTGVPVANVERAPHSAGDGDRPRTAGLAVDTKAIKDRRGHNGGQKERRKKERWTRRTVYPFGRGTGVTGGYQE